ncbi:LysM peptidoglycan-binding domain-containing protein [Pseudalkalibacillus berkeleyi]|uniref:LysM peptidoglycan-binding domain-containing protein n=1 Tax=Pseudalkalibacillus berkeleyi TaxID=1069813 RepID=A0ABS9H200_9BACL|nr:LysM domain-containing protein [Pseudalkalibacillus berkeleyi]MCF6137931.1 LysM peptidoglycan-binding domain-containing protein [Pseudalkalibacillus berkeleyi]
MKKFSIAFLAFLLFYSVYFDLKIGTLPAKNDAIPVNAAYSGEINVPAYKEVVVQPGDTMLTIMERVHNGSLPVSIDTAVKNFEELNPGTSAHAIKANQSYRFPLFQ